MTVYVVTDSTACLPPALADEYGITVLDIHTRGKVPVADAGSVDAGGADGTGDAPGAAGEAGDGSEDRAGDVGLRAEASEKAHGAGAADPGDADGSTDSSGDADGAEDGRDGADDRDREDDRDGEEDAPTTAGLGPLELTAAYARLLERGGDEGVVALHLSRELSSTWSSATQAAGVFGGLVNVLDTGSAGMVLGQAAIAAARASASGGSLTECTAAAQHVLDGAEVWLYIHRLDALSRGGRLSTAQRLLSTALAIKPILRLSDGKIGLAAKTRTPSKAMARLVTLAEDAYRKAATPEPTEEPVTGRDPASGVDGGSVATPGAGESRDTTDTVGATGAGAGSGAGAVTGTGGGVDGAGDGDRSREETPDEGRPRVFTFGGDHEFRLRRRREEPVSLSELPAVPMHLDIHQAGCPEVAEDLRATLREDLPDCVVISVVDISPALLVHTGPEAIGITLVHG